MPGHVSYWFTTLWCSQNLPAPFSILLRHWQETALASSELFHWLVVRELMRWSVGFGPFLADTVAAKAPRPSLHAETFSGLIGKFKPLRPLKTVRIMLFDFPTVTWGWFPLWAALCPTLPSKLPPRNGSERFWTIMGVFAHGVWLGRFGLALGGFFVCFLVFLHYFCGFNPPGNGVLLQDLKKQKDSITQTIAAVKSELGIEPFQGFVSSNNAS